MPLVDEQQSYTLLSLEESDGQTIMTFQRSIQSCDDQDFHITVRQQYNHTDSYLSSQCFHCFDDYFIIRFQIFYDVIK